jgi:hypothetical protein
MIDKDWTHTERVQRSPTPERVQHSPTTERVEWIAQHMESLGAYTQAQEVRRLVRQRDRLLAAMGAAVARDYVEQFGDPRDGQVADHNKGC